MTASLSPEQKADEGAGRVPTAPGSIASGDQAASHLVPSGNDPSRADADWLTRCWQVQAWLVAMSKQGEDQVWRGAEKALAYFAALESERNTYRGWAISHARWPEPAWHAAGPNYDAWTEGEGEWVDNGEKASAPTREALLAEIDAWIEQDYGRMIDAALDAEWLADAPRGCTEQQWSIREILEDKGFSTPECEKAMRAAFDAASAPDRGNEYEVAYDRDGPR